jgi:drug/metabolite transporter (DMT)-like permease
VLDQVTPGVPAIISTTWIVTGAAAAFAGALPFAGGYVLPPTPAAWGAVLGLVVGSTILGFVFFVVGLKRVGPQSAAILGTFEPVGTLFLAMLFLGERLGAAQWAGAALILGAAFVLAARSGRDAAPVPAAAPD